MGFYTQEEVKKIGFRKVGNNILISDKTSIYNPGNIEIGNNVRIDDFCIISAGQGGIKIHNNVHIACYCSLVGGECIEMLDFSGLSSRVSVYSSSDDYSGEYLTNPTVDPEFINVISRPVSIGKHVIIGSGSVVLPGVSLSCGVSVGALSLVTKSFGPFLMIGGIPSKVIKKRSEKIIDLEWKYKKKYL